MGQVTIYLDDEVEQKMRAEAKALHLSQSKWIAQLIRERLTDRWPEGVAGLVGAWKEFPEAEEIRKGLPADAAREAL